MDISSVTVNDVVHGGWTGACFLWELSFLASPATFVPFLAFQASEMCTHRGKKSVGSVSLKAHAMSGMGVVDWSRGKLSVL